MPSLKLIPIKISVTGSGEFPIDMLRYDGCFPLSEGDSGLIESSYSHSIASPEAGEFPPIKIKVILLKPNGYKHWTPSYSRWKSFGWEVIECEKRKDL